MTTVNPVTEHIAALERRRAELAGTYSGDPSAPSPTTLHRHGITRAVSDGHLTTRQRVAVSSLLSIVGYVAEQPAERQAGLWDMVAGEYVALLEAWE